MREFHSRALLTSPSVARMPFLEFNSSMGLLRQYNCRRTTGGGLENSLFRQLTGPPVFMAGLSESAQAEFHSRSIVELSKNSWRDVGRRFSIRAVSQLRKAPPPGEVRSNLPSLGNASPHWESAIREWATMRRIRHLLTWHGI